MVKKSGYLIYDSLPGEITTGCINTPKLGERFCSDHLQDHQELDKQKPNINLDAASKEFGTSLGPVLRSSKRKGEENLWGQIGEIMEKRCLRNKTFYKVGLHP